MSMYTCYPAFTYGTAEHQGCLFWITYKWLKVLRKASHLQIIQNSAPSVAGRYQCCIRIIPQLKSGLGFTVWSIFCETSSIPSLVSLLAFCGCQVPLLAVWLKVLSQHLVKVTAIYWVSTFQHGKTGGKKVNPVMTEGLSCKLYCFPCNKNKKGTKLSLCHTATPKSKQGDEKSFIFKSLQLGI